MTYCFTFLNEILIYDCELKYKRSKIVEKLKGIYDYITKFIIP